MRKQQNSYLSLAIVLAVLIVINIIASHLYQRFDLTENKRYTLSETSKEKGGRGEERFFRTL